MKEKESLSDKIHKSNYLKAFSKQEKCGEFAFKEDIKEKIQEFLGELKKKLFYKSGFIKPADKIEGIIDRLAKEKFGDKINKMKKGEEQLNIQGDLNNGKEKGKENKSR